MDILWWHIVETGREWAAVNYAATEPLLLSICWVFVSIQHEQANAKLHNYMMLKPKTTIFFYSIFLSSLTIDHSMCWRTQLPHALPPDYIWLKSHTPVWPRAIRLAALFHSHSRNAVGMDEQWTVYSGIASRVCHLHCPLCAKCKPTPLLSPVAHSRGQSRPVEASHSFTLHFVPCFCGISIYSAK